MLKLKRWLPFLYLIESMCKINEIYFFCEVPSEFINPLSCIET